MKKEIKIPEFCPSCESPLTLVNAQLFCRNSKCSAQSSKRVEAFAKTMKIKGLGPATIDKLELTDPLEIYELNTEFLNEVLGEKLGIKLESEINRSTSTDIGTFLSAMSIPLIGSVAGQKIAERVDRLEDIPEYLDEIEIGQKAKFNLLDWMLSNEKLLPIIDSIFTFNKKKSVKKDKGNVCITGKLNDFKNRTEAKNILENHGYNVTSSVSGKTDYLVCEDNSTSSKVQKAKQLNIKIVTVKELINE